MPRSLRASANELLDLAHGMPQLFESSRGVFTGMTLQRFIGEGGMSTVFLAELDPAQRSHDLSPLTPRRLAIKFMKGETESALMRFNMDPLSIFVREAVALGRVMERKPPTEFVVGFYGSGKASVSIAGAPERALPWLAIEYVDGGTAGTSLTERVRRAPSGVDPVRAYRLIRGLFEGVRVLHEERIVHRDLKPDNVLISGPLDDETPKLADCGIARIEGMPGSTVAALTPEYGGPEQALSIPGQSNPLVGTWTDVHALAAVVWFVLAGEPWCTSSVDRAWHAGERRSLRTAARLHSAFVQDPAVIPRLDLVLSRGAAHKLPQQAWEKPGAERLAAVANQPRYRSMRTGVERYADLYAFANDLFPILEEVCAAWTSRAAQENFAATAFRPTQMLRSEDVDKATQLAKVREVPATEIDGTNSTFGGGVALATPGNVVFQPDGKVLARFGERLIYFVGHEPHKVGVPDALRATVEASRWLVRGPGGGFALVGPHHVILVKGGKMTPMQMPARPGEVGEIQAAVGDGRVFGVVTAETDDSNGGPELWRSTDGTSWSAPSVLPIGGDVHTLADGPYGLLVVGSRKGKNGRALFLGLNEQTTVYTSGVNDKPALRAAVCGAGREAWGAAGPVAGSPATAAGVVLRFELGVAVPEKSDAEGVPAQMALDMVGVPWLVTERTVARRHVEGNEGVWRVYYRRDPARPPLVGIGFTPDGATVLDARGGAVELEPHDIAIWRPRPSQVRGG